MISLHRTLAQLRIAAAHWFARIPHAAGLHQRLSTVEVKMRRGHRMILDLGSAEQRSAFVERGYDEWILRTCLSLLPLGAVALDIGAHVGLYTCALGRCMQRRGGSLYAFEPVETNFERLRANVALNDLHDTVEVARVALGRERGELELFVVPGSATNNAVGANMFQERHHAQVAHEGWRRDSAPVLRLDDWAGERELSRCDFIKIDVEGAELEVFHGARGLLDAHRPAVLAELNPYWMDQLGQSFADVRAFFEPLDYRIFREIEGAWLPVTPERIAQAGQVPSYLLLPAERAFIPG